ncbi:MAG: hypothetical protein U1E76_24550 [Planctomycetota bacterium]
MSAFAGLLDSTGAVLTLALLTVFLLLRPLDRLLAELCGSVSRARFWSVFTAVSVVLVSILGMLLSLPLGDAKLWAAFPLLPIILAALRMSLAFMLAALGVIAVTLLTAIGRFEEQRRRSAAR